MFLNCIWVRNKGCSLHLRPLSPLDTTRRQFRDKERYVFHCNNITTQSTKHKVSRMTLPSNNSYILADIQSPDNSQTPTYKVTRPKQSFLLYMAAQFLRKITVLSSGYSGLHIASSNLEADYSFWVQYSVQMMVGCLCEWTHTHTQTDTYSILEGKVVLAVIGTEFPLQLWSKKTEKWSELIHMRCM